MVHLFSASTLNCSPRKTSSTQLTRRQRHIELWKCECTAKQGASGARICVDLIHALNSRGSLRKGLATMCIGGGQGVALAVEAAQQQRARL